MKTITITLFLFFSCFAFSQVGVGNTDPKSTLDISASSTTSPTNEDGILIPRIDNFPTTNPTADQDGMMVFYTGTSLSGKGFYYWDNATTSWLSIQGNEDTDWLRTGTGGPASNITDNIYTLGQVQIGGINVANTSSLKVTSDLTSNFSGFQLLHSGSDSGQIGYGIYNQSTITDAVRFSNFHNANSGTHNNTHYGFENFFTNNGTGLKVGLYNEFDLSAPNGNKKGVYNRFEGGNSDIYGIDNSMPGAWTVAGNIYGINNNIRSGGNGQHYGVKTELDGSGSGNKYGYFVDISSTAGGTHYGIFSDVRNTSGYAAYFRGRASFGNDGINRYFMPASDGTAGQIMTTNGSGQLSFSNPVSGEWTDGGSYISPSDGDSENVLIGSTTTGTAKLGITTGVGSTNSGIEINFDGTADYGIKTELTSGTGLKYGLYNDIGGSNGNYSTWGTYNNVTAAGDGSRIATFNTVNSTGTGNKYAIWNYIPITDPGTHYGIYSDVQNVSGYAAYLLGRTSLGNSTSNRYIMPAADGNSGQVMTTDGAGNVTFQSITGDGNTQNTLDQAYNEGGSGAGNTITANAGAVTIDGTDGILVSGFLGSGATISSPAINPTMFFNPRTGSFRSGMSNGTSWDTSNTGDFSVAFGSGNTASGYTSTAIGVSTIASGGRAFSGGSNSISSGIDSFSFGFECTANATGAVSMGVDNTSHSLGEFTVGTYSTDYTASGTLAWNINDRVFSVGNGSSTSARSNALTIYKSGEININDAYSLPTTDGSTGQVMTTDGAGNVTFQNPTTNTDDQQIDNLGLVGTVLGISLEDDGVAPATVDLAFINTDNQQIDNFSFNSTTNILTLEIEDDGQAAQTVDLSSLNLTKSLARITMSADQSFTTGTWQKLNFDTVDFDLNSEFNTTTDEFDISTTGYYRINASWRSTNTSTSTSAFGIAIVVNGIFEGAVNFNNSGSGNVFRSINRILDLSAGDTVEIQILNSGLVDVYSNDIVTSFEIEQIQ